MAEELPPAADAPPPAPAKKRRLPWIGLTLLGLLLLVGGTIIGGMRWLDSTAGHRYVAALIADMRLASGLRIDVGAIEGSLFNRVRLRDLRFSDPQGTFARIETAELQWYPLAWASNRLDIDWLHIGTARLDRLPRLRSTGARKSILPDFDIRLMDLRVARLELGAALAGKPHVVRAEGRLDIRRGRAVIDLRAAARDSGDMLRLSLDSRPDDDRFDVDALATAPAGGLIGGLAGIREPMAFVLRGEGSWSQWRGRFVAQRARGTMARLDIDARSGAYRVTGPVSLGGLLPMSERGPAMLDAGLRFERRVVSGTARLLANGFVLDADGGIDLGRARFDELRLGLKAADPKRLPPAFGGRPMDFKVRLSGPFDTAEFEALLSAPELRSGGLALSGLRLQGEGRLAPGGGRGQIRLSAAALRTGQPALDERLRGFGAQGAVRYREGKLALGPMALRASGLAGQLAGDASLASGALALRLDARMGALELPGLGRLDLGANVRIAQPAGGRLGVDGTIRAAMLRLDNGFLRGIAGGLPTLSSRIALAPDGAIAFTGLDLQAPALTLAGEGARAADGSVRISARGNHADYGPLALRLDGDIARPHVDVMLDHPGQGLRLADVHAVLAPVEAGYALTGSGKSMLGPFTADATILLPPGGEARIDVAAIRLGEVLAKGMLTPVAGGLTGRLDLSGPAEGRIALSVAGEAQRLGLDIDLGSVRFAGPLALSVNRGQVKADMTLRRHAVGIEGELQARGVRYGSLRLGRLSGTASLENGAGLVELSASAQNGRAFNLAAKAEVRPERVAITLSGTLDRQPARLLGPAVLERRGEEWQLLPTTLRTRGGRVTVAGLFGPDQTHLEARMRKLPLSILDLADAELGLGGTADGTLSYDLPRNGVPGGTLSLRIHGLTRSGLALSSAPIDIGINASLNDQRGAVRAVIADGGKVVGRAQALLTPFGPGSLMERLNKAPLQAQIAYGGSADTLWRLANIELLSLGGHVSIAARASGTLADPIISGTVSAQDASLQSPATGMALSRIAARGEFNGSELLLSNLKGQTAGNGTVTGTALFTFSSARGIGMDVQLDANRAVLLDRDDVGATVTGPLRLRSDGGAGTISGDLDVVASRFTLGRASAVAEIPQIRLIEINRAGEEAAPARVAEPWRLDIKARANRGLNVEGLGMQSEWAADLAITGAVTAPVFRGTATLVSGSYDFAGKRFDLREGRLTFTGTTPVNPVLDIRAVADVSDLNATISVTGTSLRPVVTMTSIPAMPQDELLSRLLFGTSITKLSAPEALQLASAVAAFQGAGSGLDPINAVRRATGLSRLRILPADATTGQKTAIAAGKNIGKLYVELISDGQGYSATRVEFQITRWLSLLSTVSTVGRQNVGARISKDY